MTRSPATILFALLLLLISQQSAFAIDDLYCEDPAADCPGKLEARKEFCKTRHAGTAPGVRRRRQTCLIAAVIQRNNCELRCLVKEKGICAQRCIDRYTAPCARRCKKINAKRNQTLQRLVCRRDCSTFTADSGAFLRPQKSRSFLWPTFYAFVLSLSLSRTPCTRLWSLSPFLFIFPTPSQ